MIQSPSLFSIDLKPEWSELDKISKIVKEFLNNASFNGDDFETINMVSTELVENGIKYGFFPFPARSWKNKKSPRESRRTIIYSIPNKGRKKMRRMTAHNRSNAL